jgi:hypothetical protein
MLDCHHHCGSCKTYVAETIYCTNQQMYSHGQQATLRNSYQQSSENHTHPMPQVLAETYAHCLSRVMRSVHGYMFPSMHPSVWPTSDMHNMMTTRLGEANPLLWSPRPQQDNSAFFGQEHEYVLGLLWIRAWVTRCKGREWHQ